MHVGPTCFRSHGSSAGQLPGVHSHGGLDSHAALPRWGRCCTGIDAGTNWLHMVVALLPVALGELPVRCGLWRHCNAVAPTKAVLLKRFFCALLPGGLCEQRPGGPAGLLPFALIPVP